jgi:hypothetical protein
MRKVGAAERTTSLSWEVSFGEIGWEESAITSASDLRRLEEIIVGAKPVVLIFLPNTNELQRFVIAGAFKDLVEHFQLRFVFSPQDADKMRAAAPDLLGQHNTYELGIPPERYRQWMDVFERSCHVYADLSPSFALRIGAKKVPKQNQIADSLRLYCRRTFERLPRRFQSAPLRQLLAAPGGREAELAEHLQRLEPYAPMIELLDEVDPLFCILPTSLLDIYCNDLLLACKEACHTVFALQSGWDNLSSKGIIHHAPQFMGVWGPQSAKHAGKIQRLTKRSVVCLGAPHYEALVQTPPSQRQQLRTQLGVLPNQRLILFGGSFRQFDETDALRRLEEAIEAGELDDVKVLYRPHPWRADRLHEDNFFDQDWKHIVFDPDMKDRYMRSKAAKGFLKTAPMFDMQYLAEVLSTVDAVISPMSTLLMESLIMGKPTMAVAFGDNKHTYNPAVSSQMTHFREIRKSRALLWCDEENRFIEACRDLLDRPTRAIDGEARQQTIDTIVTLNDGSYSQRLAAFCRTTVDPMGRQRRQKRYARQRKNISHSYFAHLIARDYCGLRDVPSDIPGYWMHGWMPPSFNVHPLLIASQKSLHKQSTEEHLARIEAEKVLVPQWVSREDQEAYLREQGYANVQTIGLPFAYLPPVAPRRLAGSLLVMPPHSHRAHGPGDPLADAYAEAIASKRNEFSHIAVCLNYDDYIRHEWITQFQKRGIRVFVGAEQADPSTMLRLKQLLSSFEYVTTNGFGSHIAYAAACGAKLSVFGPWADFPRVEMAKGFAMRLVPELTDIGCELHSEKALRKECPFLFVDPEKATTHLEWGQKQIGEDQLLPRDELMRLFRWRAAPGTADLLAKRCSADAVRMRE